MLVASFVESLTHGGDTAVHHIGGRDDVGTGLGEGDSLTAEIGERGIIVHGVVVVEDTAVAVIGVLAHTDICDDDEVGQSGLEGADTLLYDAVV